MLDGLSHETLGKCVSSSYIELYPDGLKRLQMTSSRGSCAINECDGLVVDESCFPLLLADAVVIL